MKYCIIRPNNKNTHKEQHETLDCWVKLNWRLSFFGTQWMKGIQLHWHFLQPIEIIMTRLVHLQTIIRDLKFFKNLPNYYENLCKSHRTSIILQVYAQKSTPVQFLQLLFSKLNFQFLRRQNFQQFKENFDLFPLKILHFISLILYPYLLYHIVLFLEKLF